MVQTGHEGAESHIAFHPPQAVIHQGSFRNIPQLHDIADFHILVVPQRLAKAA